MKRISLLFLLLLSGMSGICTTWIVTNSGFTFTPATITITIGDDVNFTLDDIHNAIEVNESTWNANGSSPLTGGFQTPLGGGLVQPSQLGIGTHYYVCAPHASSGMKGIIIVQNATGIQENQLLSDFSVYPNPAHNSLTIKASNHFIDSEFSITDPTGRRVFVGKLEDETMPVDITNLKQGIYLVQIEGKRRQFVKVIKY